MPLFEPTTRIVQDSFIGFSLFCFSTGDSPGGTDIGLGNSEAMVVADADSLVTAYWRFPTIFEREIESNGRENEAAPAKAFEEDGQSNNMLAPATVSFRLKFIDKQL